MTSPLPCSTSRTKLGNSVSKIVPTTQNQARPSTESHTGRIEAAWRTTCHISAGIFGLMRSGGSAGGGGGGRGGGAAPTTTTIETRPRATGGAAVELHQCAADNRACENGQEGRGLDGTIAGDQLVIRQMLGQETVLERAHHRGLHAQAEDHGEHGDFIAADDGKRRGGHQHG